MRTLVTFNVTIKKNQLLQAMNCATLNALMFRLSRGLTEENTQLGIICPVVCNMPNLVFLFCNLEYFIQLGSGDLLPCLTQKSTIGYIIPNWRFVIPNRR